MKALLFKSAAPLALALALAGCGAMTAGSGEADAGPAHRFGSIDFQPCTLDGGTARAVVEARCGTLEVAEDPAAPGGRQVGLNIAWLPATGALSVLRALRVLRVLRLVSVVPSLRLVVEAMLRALPGMGSIILLMGLIFYVFAVMVVPMRDALGAERRRLEGGCHTEENDLPLVPGAQDARGLGARNVCDVDDEVDGASLVRSLEAGEERHRVPRVRPKDHVSETETARPLDRRDDADARALDLRGHEGGGHLVHALAERRAGSGRRARVRPLPGVRRHRHGAMERHPGRGDDPAGGLR